MSANRNVLSISVDYQDFFKSWVALTKPIHRLTNTESEVFACFLKHRYELSKMIQDGELLDNVLMSEDTKRKIREECNVKSPHFQVIMGKLRKKKVLVDGKFADKLIPNLDYSDQPFGLMFVLDIKK